MTVCVEFVEVNKDNWHECINLPTSDAHRWVASNLYSIGENPPTSSSDGGITGQPQHRA